MGFFAHSVFLVKYAMCKEPQPAKFETLSVGSVSLIFKGEPLKVEKLSDRRLYKFKVKDKHC